MIFKNSLNVFVSRIDTCLSAVLRITLHRIVFSVALLLLLGNNALAQTPTITSFNPTTGPVGTSITITGTNFDATPANNIVFFGATQAAVSAASSTELTVTVPVGATYQPITVLTNGLLAYSSQPFVVTFNGVPGIDATSFDAKVDVSIGSNPISISLGDLDGDGKSDMVGTSIGTDLVSIYRNTSTSGVINSGSFAAAQTLTPGTDPFLVAIGDLDNDGRPDLAVANFSSNTVSLFRNTSPSAGTISYASKVDLVTGGGPTSVAIGDIDGDGRAELAVTNTTAGTVSIFHNTSPGSGTFAFTTKVDFSAGTEPYGVALGDLDNDGKVDIAVANQGSNTVSVFRNTSTSGVINSGSFAAKQDFSTGSVPYEVSIGDLDGDGKLDLVTPNFGGASISVIRNTSTSGIINSSSFATKQDFTVGALPQSISIGDLDGDGKVDLAVANRSSTSLSIFRNTSSSGTIDVNSFATKVDFTTGTEPVSITIGDIDGDGKSDIAVANILGNTVSVFRNTILSIPTITSFAPSSGAVGTSVTIIGTNFSATPANNIVFFGATQAAVTAATTTQLTVTVPVGATYQPITVLTNGLIAYSNKPFVVTFNGVPAIDVNSFAAKVDFTTGVFPPSVSIGDLDGDGKADLVVANYNSGTVSVFRNTSSAGSISYAAKVDFTTGSLPISVSIGDLDGDGKADLAVANFTSTVSVFRNTGSVGTISYAAKVDFTTGTNPYSVSIGDLDGDGKADLAVTNYLGNTVSVFHNTGSVGTISYATKVDFTTGTNPISVSIGDLDGDGKADLAVANDGSNNVSVFRNISSGAGSISYASKTDFTTGTNPQSVSIGDLDGDGKADLAVANDGSNNVSVFRNISSGAGSISYAAKVDFTTGTNPRSVSIGDLDGDGKADLAVTNYTSATVSVFRNTSSVGSISYTAKVDFATGTNPLSVSIGDLDGDGKADLAVANNGNASVSVLRNLIGSPTITSFTPTSGAVGTSIIITGTRFDSTPANNIIFFGATQAAVTAATSTSLTVTVPVGATYQPITVLTNGLIAYSNKPFVVTFNGVSGIDANSFDTKVDFTTETNPYSVSIGDLDGDGKADLAVTHNNNASVSVFSNTGSAGSISYAPKVDFTTGTNSTSVSIGDLDGDGKADLAVTNYTSATVSVFRNTSSIGSISYAAKVDFATGTNPISVSIGDLDGDGKADLAVTNNGSGTVSVFRNTSSGAGSISYAAKVDFTTGTSPLSVSIGDLDGDGKADLAVANFDSNTISVFRNTGVVIISYAAKVDFTTGTSPRSVSIGDLDGDGMADLAVANAGSDNVSVFHNTGSVGSIGYATKADFPTGVFPGSVSIGDLDGDGKADLAVANVFSDNVSVFRNTGSVGSISYAAKVDFTTGTNPRSVSIGDLDGDGKADLAVANNGSATVSVFRNTILSIPTITSFTPTSGAVGTSVTITGTNFDTTPANNIVKFNGTVATIVGTPTSTSIIATVPVGATTGKITVEVAGQIGTSATDFTVIQPPTITSFAPASGIVGASVTITGTNFDTTPANNIAKFNGTAATITGTPTATSIVTTVPTGATTGMITVEVAGQVGTSATNFTVIQPPTITSFAPASGIVGTSVTITGTNFDPNASNNLKFNGTLATISSITATSIITTVPVGATTGPITIEVGVDIATSATDFTVSVSMGNEPTVPASNLVLTQPFASTINVTWTNGNGSSRLVVAKQGGVVDQSPVDGTSYIAAVSFTSGDDLGGGNYVVYNGTGSSVSVTDVQPSMSYAFFVFEYNGTSGSEDYNPSSAVDNPKSITTTATGDTTPPSVTDKTVATVDQGNNISIIVTLTDAESGIATAKVKYRSTAAGGSFTTSDLVVPSSGNDYTFTAPSSSVGELGMEYQFEVTNGGGLTNTPVLKVVKLNSAATGLAIPYSSFGKEEANYRIVAVPLSLTAATVGGVFDELMPYDDTRWRMFHYENNANKELNGSSAISAGKGYWLIIKANQSIMSGAGTSVQATSDAQFSVPLVQGWNQIGNPYNFNLSWADVQAANAGLPGLRKWINTMTDGTTLDKTEGGFVNATTSGTLVFPVVKNATVNGGRTREEEVPFRNALDQPNWQVYINLDQGKLMNRIAGVGMNESASDDYDIYDGLSMPRFFDSFLDVNHAKQANGNFYSKDIVTTTQNYVWEFSVATSGVEPVMTFSWDNSYFGSNDREIYLWDAALQRSINMRKSQSYAFDKNVSKTFKVLFGSAEFVNEKRSIQELTLHKVWPNPAAEEVNIAFTLPGVGGEQAVNITMIDFMGRKVWAHENLYQSGYNEVKWKRNKEVTAGIYLVTVESAGSYQQVRMILR